MKIALLAILLFPLQASAQISLCDSLGQTRLATYRDVASHTHEREPKVPNDKKINDPKGNKKTACPPTALASGGFCFEYATVGFCNSQGLGSCQKLGNKYTQECFNAEVCLQSTQGKGGMCVREAQLADASIANAPGCNNMSGHWVDNYQEEYVLFQDEGSPFITGVGDPIYGLSGSCGTWEANGTLIGDSNLSVTLSNNNPPKPGCCNPGSFTFSGTAACGVAFGTWTNTCGYSGTMDWQRSDSLGLSAPFSVPQGTFPGGK